VPPSDLDLCESGWDKFQGSCYRHFSKRQSWEAAEQHCRLGGAHLLSVMTPEEQDHVNGKTPEEQDHVNGKTPEEQDHVNGKTPEEQDHGNGKTPEEQDHLDLLVHLVVVVWRQRRMMMMMMMI